MRRKITLLMVLVGFLFQIDAYLFLAARIGSTSGPWISNPRVPFAPVIFIVGVMFVFIAAIVYETMSEKPDDHDR